MDNVGDWLYIVLLVIAGISNLFSSKNKGKGKTPKQIEKQPDREIVAGEDHTPEKGFWEILEEMQNPKQVKHPTTPPKRKPKRKQVTEPAPFLPVEKAAERLSPIGEHQTTLPIDENNTLADIEFDNAAELRKAVIYTEILNRKY